jgi:cellulose synthase/poly-beta-1,6-N-acetylglucosamine synthase-like glycosyltransferase
MTGTGLVALLIAAIPTLLLAIYTIEIVAGLRPLASSRQAEDSGLLPRTVVLIPAHNEAAGIGATLAALRAITDPAVELLVVADNCSDDTAQCARDAGAQVVERHDPVRRGKGYALAFGRDALAAAPPACVVVLDADCGVAGAGIAALARATTAAGRAHQACNLQRPNRTASPTAQISSFAFLVKNLVRQRGMVRVGGVAAMTGTGMAVPWPQFAEAPLASADLAEDMALGVWLTRSGRSPRFLETVEIWSDAASGSALATQRHRWERGLLSIARRAALPLVANGFAKASRSALWLGLHIMVPPLALLFAGASAAFLLTLLLAQLGAGFGPSLVLAVALCFAGVATIAAWASAGRDQIGGAELLRIPLYIVRKLPLYRMMLHRRGRDHWVRTRRAGEADEL